MIELKNIDLSSVTLTDQIRKVYEEEEEFVAAVVSKNLDNAVEEFFDLMQASLGALHKLGLNAEYIMGQYSAHLEKIKDRPR